MNFLTRFTPKQKMGAGIAAALLVVLGVLGYNGSLERFAPRSAYEEVYKLVPDSISQNAAVPVSLPEGTKLTVAEAKTQVVFTPEIAGTWTNSGAVGTVVYQPNEPLPKGTQYTVALTLPEGTLQKNFIVDEDPKVIAVFPKEGTEAPENSAVSIVFNRPMVPLTTLEELSNKNIPVTISPKTAGSFKWISTRILQFVPTDRLIRSQNYTVSINKGFVSLDGLPVPTQQFSFNTRALRFEGGEIHHQGTTVHSEPIVIRFNQPVNLEKTRSQVALTNTSTGAPVPFVLDYGTRSVYNEKTLGYDEYIDKSVLAVYNSRDSHGRARVWDADTSYSVTIAGATPLEGDITLGEFRNALVSVPSYIAGVTATSPRSSVVSTDLFDPEGTLVVQLYEDIDKNASSISAPGLSNIEYGEKCKDTDSKDYYYNSSGCEKVVDQSKLILSFKGARFEKGQQFNLEFKKIVDSHGVTITSEKITRAIKTYPTLAIIRTTPNQGIGSVRELAICSTSPIAQPKEETFYTQFTANAPIGKWNWGSARLITSEILQYSKCSVGEYESTLFYSLRPETSYQLTLNLIDDFGQTIAQKVAFTTEKLPYTYRKLSALQKDFNVTSPEKTKLTFSAENLEYVDVHICEVSPLTMLGYLNYDSRPAQSVPGENLPCVKTYTKQIDLPDAYWVKNYFQFSLSEIIPGGALGQYVVTLSHPDLRSETYDYERKINIPGNRIYPHSLLSVTRLAVQSKVINASSYGEEQPSGSATALAKTSGNLYWVSQIGTLAAVPNATVDVYQSSRSIDSPNSGLIRATQVLTGGDGVARTGVFDNVLGAIVTSGNDTAVVSETTDKFEWGYGQAPAIRTYLYTDRPIYRPGQEVHFKGLTRLGYDGDYEVWRTKPAEVKIYDSRGEVIFTQSMPITEYGTFASKIVLPIDAPLGSYRIEGMGGYGYFDVEEYAAAAFKVDIQGTKDEFIAGDMLSLNLSADYYFGVPVEKGEVEYSIVSQDYYFDRYQDEYFNFGNDWYYSPYSSYGDTYITRGELFLDSSGKGTISQKLDFTKFFKDEAAKKSKIFVVRATVKNSTGQSISTEKSFIVHRGEKYLGVNVDQSYFAKGQSTTIRAKTVDTQGKPTSLSGINGEIYRISWNYFKRQEVDGRFYYTSEEKQDLVDSFRFSTNGSGNAERKYTPDTEGHYRIILKGTDGSGNPLESTRDFYVFGSGTVDVRPTNNEALEIVVDKNKLLVGDTGSFVITSPFKRAKALITLERGQIFDYKIVDINQSLYSHSFTVPKPFVPNVYASVLLLSETPEVKYGRANFEINSIEQTLDVTVKTDKKSYLPGEKVTLSVTTKNSKGTPTAAEVSVAVADLSVLALKGNPKKNPVAFFYDGLPLAINTSSNIKNVLTEAEIPTGTKGGGGLEASELAKKKRGIFKDTAYWSAVVRTDALGTASVSFTLPDNLTTWQAEAVGITVDTKVGAGYSELIAQKTVSLTPLIPRFVLPGDSFMVGAKVFNNSESSQKLTVSLASTTLKLKGGASQTVSLAPKTSETAYFEVEAPRTISSGNYSLVLSAKNSTYEDTVDQTLPIGTTSFLETTATASFTSQNSAKEYLYVPSSVLPDLGGLTVTAESSLAPQLGDALNYLVAYPYGCSEQVASRIAAIAILTRYNKATGNTNTGLQSIEFAGQTYTANDLIKLGLEKMYAGQTSDGGFSYYTGLKANYPLTLSVLTSLQEIKAAGYTVDTKVMDSAARYVYTYMVNPPQGARLDSTAIVMGVEALTRLGGTWNSGPYASYFEGQIATLAANKTYLNDQAPNPVIATLALITTRGYAANYKETVFAALENRLSIEARGSFITSGTDNRLYDYYETAEKNTALYLKALVASKRENQVIDGVLRWLVARKQPNGGWGTTNATMSVLDAFADYAVFKREKDSAFNVTVFLGDTQLASATLSNITKDTRASVTTPITAIPKNKIVLLVFTKTDTGSAPGTLYYSAALTYGLPTEKIGPRDEGFAISRAFYAKDDTEYTKPLTSAKAGDVIRGRLTITVPKDRTLVAVEDYIPAGMELVNLSLATEDQSLDDTTIYGGPRGSTGGIGGLAAAIFGLGKKELADKEYGPATVTETLYPDTQELRDDRLFLFKENLLPGVYTFDYYVRALIPGTYSHLPAMVSQLYAPEVFGRSAGELFTIKK